MKEEASWRRSSRTSSAPISSSTTSASPDARSSRRVDIGPTAPLVKHTHPGEEIIYVLEGSLEYQVEGEPPTTLKAGDVLFVPAGTIHAVTNVGSGNAAEPATYVVEKGKPLLTLVE